MWILGNTAFNLRYTLGTTDIKPEEKETNYMASYTRYWIMFVVALIAPFNVAQATSEGQHDFLFFLNGGPTYHQVSSEDGIQENDFILGADILYSYRKGDFRFIAEYAIG